MNKMVEILEHNLDEWRRLHDWIVLKRGTSDLIEEIISLGHKYSSLLKQYKSTLDDERKAILFDLRVTLHEMMTLYDKIRHKHHFPLHFKELP
ncbi:MAG: hypothetical protein D6736_04915 [Nitrospinota bacterium]|nr:MAG: hypothetical protein D6736_04915 [Nitrospinota bacterium]